MNIKKILDYINKLTSKKNTFNLIVIFLIGVLLILVADFFSGTAGSIAPKANQVSSGTQNAEGKNTSDYEAEQKAELKSILSKIDGIGRVEVMIKFDGGEEIVPAVNTNNGDSVTTESDNQGGKRQTTQKSNDSTVVMESNSGDSKPVILQKLHPKVRAVWIVADGAEDTEVRQQTVKAVSAFFGIPNYNVIVYKMQK